MSHVKAFLWWVNVADFIDDGSAEEMYEVNTSYHSNLPIVTSQVPLQGHSPWPRHLLGPTSSASQHNGNHTPVWALEETLNHSTVSHLCHQSKALSTALPPNVPQVSLYL